MVFLGLVAIHDAPRPEIISAMKKTKQAGIKVVMITGDNEKTAEAVGVSAGIIQEGDEILTGIQIEEYSDQDLLKILPKVKIFARTNPFQKHRIVKLFQSLGEVVAVTGDGVNDAIALKQSDVGIAMGLVGTDVARETADMVITDDNFATIVNAIEEGRNIIKNIKNAIKYLLACNVTEGLSLMSALMIGINHLFYPIQLLYINLVTDGLPALSLAFSPKNSRLMSEAPEEEMTLLKPFDKKYIFLVGIFGTLLVLGSYFIWGKTAAFTVLTLIQPFILIDLWLSHQRVRKNINLLKKPIFLVSFIFPFVLQFLILRFSLTASLFKIQPINIVLYIEFIAIAGLILVGIKGVKKIIS
jgi:Ca2+-transporting ATPase